MPTESHPAHDAPRAAEIQRKGVDALGSDESVESARQSLATALGGCTGPHRGAGQYYSRWARVQSSGVTATALASIWPAADVKLVAFAINQAPPPPWDPLRGPWGAKQAR